MPRRRGASGRQRHHRRSQLRRGVRRLPRAIARIAIVASLPLAAGLVATACEGGGGELTLAEFFDELQTLNDDLADGTITLGEEFIELTEESTVDEVLVLFREISRLYGDFVEDIAGLNPPEAVEDLHNETVDAGRDVIEEFNVVLDEAAEADSIEDLFALFDVETGAAEERFTQVCLDAEQLAADNDISIDLDCGEE